MAYNLGVCKIKPEYIISDRSTLANLNVSSNNKEELAGVVKEQREELTPIEVEQNEVNGSAPGEEPLPKKVKLSKKEKKRSGQNKKRGPAYRREFDKELCNAVIDVQEGKPFPKCTRGKCLFMHDVQEYLQSKPKDIGEICYLYEKYGHCSRGIACRFGSMHITKEGYNLRDDSKKPREETRNVIPGELLWKLKKRDYSFEKSEKLIRHTDKLYQENKKELESKKDLPKSPENSSVESSEVKTSGVVTDEDLIALFAREKKLIDWRNKLFLSPLTTVGNLPFRRICKEFGVDVTCGEMAMCSSLLQGAPQEWALVKRHHTEDLFGVQLCANNTHLLTKCGQLLEEKFNIDFIDINMGCPIDLVYRQGGGCGMLQRPRLLELSVRNLSQILAVPMTVKIRTGIHSNENIAHKFIPKFREWGASLVTVHGRSREQRYTRHADWDYIKQCCQTAAPLPLLGNGDILSYEDYTRAISLCGDDDSATLAGVMIGRGALIKPWIFTEIREKRLWDIRSGERFDILRKYCNYGLEHWGADNKGVENTRKFMLEWLSFLHRYIPVGLLEQPPQQINERPPYYRGRDELETLMASSHCSDWIKITEMMLGPVPTNFTFVPKHKANSY